MKKLLSLVLVLLMILGIVACGTTKPAETPAPVATQAPAAEKPAEQPTEAPKEPEAPKATYVALGLNIKNKTGVTIDEVYIYPAGGDKGNSVVAPGWQDKDADKANYEKNIYIVREAGAAQELLVVFADGTEAKKDLGELKMYTKISMKDGVDPAAWEVQLEDKAEDKAAMESISKKTLEAGADLGLIFDTDVDRCAAVDRQGHPINHDSIVALAACLIAGEHPGTTVVTDSITSDHLTDFLQEHLGLHHFRYRRGYKNVINKAQALNAEGIDCELAIETSGHAAIRENYFLDDGAYLATRIIVEAARLAGAGKTLDSLLDPLVLPKESREVRMDIHDERPRAFGDALLRDFAVWAEKQGLQIAKPNYEGVRLQFPSGWCLLRNSLHDPLMSLNMQSDKEGGTDAMAAMLKDFLGRYDALDTTAL